MAILGRKRQGIVFVGEIENSRLYYVLKSLIIVLDGILEIWMKGICFRKEICEEMKNI